MWIVHDLNEFKFTDKPQLSLEILFFSAIR